MYVSSFELIQKSIKAQTHTQWKTKNQQNEGQNICEFVTLCFRSICIRAYRFMVAMRAILFMVHRCHHHAFSENVSIPFCFQFAPSMIVDQ